MTRLFLSALLALAPTLPAAAQVRAVLSAAPAIVSAPAAIAPLGVPALIPSLSAPSIPLLPAVLPLAASVPMPADPATPSAAVDAAKPASTVERPVVLHSLQDLRYLVQAPDGRFLADAALFDGHREGKPQVLAGMPGVAVKSVRGGLAEFQAHEVATIRKIQSYTSDIKIIVRESAPTPDLIVNGVVTELKSVHRGKLDNQIEHANVQLLAHAKRHGLGLGAVVLDAVGPQLTPAQVEEKIARVVREEKEIGFSHVYVFNGTKGKTYARGADGVFRLQDSVVPFGLPAKIVRVVPAAVVSFVPPALAHAILPDIGVVTREIQEPSRLLREHGIEATVTFYGSARILSPEKARAQLDAVVAVVGRHPKGKMARKKMEDAREALRMSKYYQIARDLGALIAREGGGKVAVVTGGGPGIMEGGNRGAYEAGGPSVGYNIKLPFEQTPNPYSTPELEFTFDNFQTRQMSMRHGSMGLVYFPGGFGTMYELFEVLTLMQTNKMPKVPIVLIGERAYWDRTIDFDEFVHTGVISSGDLSLFKFAEDAPQAWAAIKAAHPAPVVSGR